MPALKRQGLDITLFMIDAKVDDTIEDLKKQGVNVIPLPSNIKASQETIASHELDILIYSDIGMDAKTHYMALARLATYQAVLVGHPDTTGIDTIDYYISNRFFEVEDAQENYTETLLLNDCVDTMFVRPPEPKQWYSRSELGLPEDKTLYTCPMTIQKLHPDFDIILKGILDKDPNAMLILFNDYQLQSSTDRMQRRVLSNCDPERVHFLGWQPMNKLWSILKESDAVLSTIYFGAGTTSQYCFAYGIPLVSMPDRYARSRMVHAYYTAMQVQDPPTGNTLEEYVEQAYRLANDKNYKARLSKEILANNAVLYTEANNYEEKARQ